METAGELARDEITPIPMCGLRADIDGSWQRIFR